MPAIRRGPESARTNGTDEEPASAGLPKARVEEHRRTGRDLTGEKGQRRAAGGDGAQRGERRHSRSVDEEERADAADADAGVLEDLAASLGAPARHQRVADVEDAV